MSGFGILCELAPSGTLTLLGFTDVGDFVVNPAKRITVTFTGGFVGIGSPLALLAYRIFDIETGDKNDDDSFTLVKQ